MVFTLLWSFFWSVGYKIVLICISVKFLSKCYRRIKLSVINNNAARRVTGREARGGAVRAAATEIDKNCSDRKVINFEAISTIKSNCGCSAALHNGSCYDHLTTPVTATLPDSGDTGTPKYTSLLTHTRHYFMLLKQKQQPQRYFEIIFNGQKCNSVSAVLRLCRYCYCRRHKKDKKIVYRVYDRGCVCCANLKLKFSPKRLYLVRGCCSDSVVMGNKKSKSSGDGGGQDSELQSPETPSSSSAKKRFSFGKKSSNDNTSECEISERRRFSFGSLSLKRSKKNKPEKLSIRKSVSYTSLAALAMRIDSPSSVRKNNRELRILPPKPQPVEVDTIDSTQNDYEVIDFPPKREVCKQNSVDFAHEILSTNKHTPALIQAGEVAVCRRHVENDPNWTISKLLNYDPPSSNRASDIYATIDETKLARTSEADLYETIIAPKLIDSGRTSSFYSEDSFHSAYENLPSSPTKLEKNNNVAVDLPDKISKMVAHKYNPKEKPPRRNKNLVPTTVDIDGHNKDGDEVGEQRTHEVHSINDIIREQHFSKRLSAYSISELITPTTMDRVRSMHFSFENSPSCDNAAKTCDIPTSPCDEEPEQSVLETKEIPKRRWEAPPHPSSVDDHEANDLKKEKISPKIMSLLKTFQAAPVVEKSVQTRQIQRRPMKTSTPPLPSSPPPPPYTKRIVDIEIEIPEIQVEAPPPIPAHPKEYKLLEKQRFDQFVAPRALPRRKLPVAQPRPGKSLLKPFETVPSPQHQQKLSNGSHPAPADFWDEPYKPTANTTPYNDQILREIVLRKKPQTVNTIDDIINDEVFSKRFSQYSISDLLEDGMTPEREVIAFANGDQMNSSSVC